MQAPIVKIIVRDGKIAKATFYTPTLPDGAHDLYCDSGDERIAELELRIAQLEDEKMDAYSEGRSDGYEEAASEDRSL